MDTPDRAGLLVVNADDLGISRQDTDAIFESFAAGAISSATALVWMSDSRRAAERARDGTLPVGLHLNLIEPYTAGDVPDRVADTQRRVVRRLRGAGSGAYVYHPSWARDFERCIADQLAQFTELYGRPPTHFDGHQHMHLAANAVLARSLGPLVTCRRPVNRTTDESRPAKRAGRALLFAALRSRFRTTRWCLSIRALDPRLSGTQMRVRLGQASHSSVEVMVHPGWEDERQVLQGDAWRDTLAGFRVGSFAELAGGR
ncbi:MAG TPA: ChbG/HpnK family deacetylase [Solirubrobacteraceae bacterium]|jgi:predicted glycoside hydrolase/deacetylase ChbG (UPF0249 family)|nr:ChbG/HpnK family deacetylase [Solirubrobacteraceae bacterium]